MSLTWEPGRRLGGRFVIEREVGRGGSGIVYLAHDLETNQPVALKVLAAEAGVAPEEEARLSREGELLAELRHRGIVRVVAAGVLDDAQPFVAMEWLEGEDVCARQRRAPLDLVHAVEVVAKVADALVAAHDVGVIHRDIKPGNIFLCGGHNGSSSALEPKVVDFGVAAKSDLRITRTGDVVGTPAYMAPEQARGDAPVDARCDIYSLGATLFELIAGRPPHVGPSAIATLARLVTTPAPRLSELRRDVPAEIDDLVRRMLATDPDDRPRNMREVSAALYGALRTSVRLPAHGRHSEPVLSSRLGSSASRLVTSIVAIRFESASTRDRSLEQLRQRGADAVPLGQDSLVAHFGARRAVGTEASTALEVGRRLARAGARVGVASGRARLALQDRDGIVQPVGEVVDRASALARDADVGMVLADTTTSELGRGRYEFKARDNGSAVVGEAVPGPRAERVGGAPFVGRDAELAQVLHAFERTCSEATPILISITGPPGIGKSRLRREVLARINAQADAPHVILQRSDAYSRGHALGAAGDILRAIIGLSKGATSAEAAEAIVVRLGPATRSELSDNSLEILARLLANQPLPEGLDPRGARDVLWLAMTELVAQVTAAQPTVIVTEDLQWADPESIGWLDHMLGRTQLRPLMVMVLVRPSFWQDYSQRFAGRDHIRLELRPISKKASRAIARALLGEQIGDDALERIAEQAGGLPLFAEELSRLTAAGRGGLRAPTIESVIQVSLDSLDDECRDAVGRLSVFGLTCWDAGLEALGLPQAESVMKSLAAAEVLVEQNTPRFPGTREWLFKHALVREVAYSSLGERERRELHALAAKWLASMGEDSATVAGHFDLGKKESAAAEHWARAAQRALATNALGDALTMAERALAFAEDKPTAFLRASYMDEAWSRLDPRAADRESAIGAMEDNVFDDASAVRASGARARYDDARGSGHEISARLAAIRDQAAAKELVDEEARCSAALAARMAFAGRLAEAELEADRLLTLAETRGITAAAVDGWQTLAIVRQTRGELTAALDARRSAVSAARKAGLKEREAMLITNLGFALTTIGARQEARGSLATGLALADAIGSSGALRHVQMNLLGWAATFGSDKQFDATLAETRSDADAAATGFWAAPDRSNLGAIFYRGWEHLRAKTPATCQKARTLLATATEGYRSTANRDVLPVALGMWADAERRCGHADRALELAREAADLLEGGAPSLLNEAAVYLALHDALRELERPADAKDAIARGMPPLERRLEGLLGTAYARLFLTQLPHNAALIATAEEYGVVPERIHRLLEG
ncbi:MAG: AAA family ATPase [Polyangiaceae bacterium]|nr:AAA family ATPase [Polyangiaceae bacterium]